MAKATIALATVLLALTTVAATAEPSYESRGYGGPLGVGPNFHSSDSYGNSERSTPKRVYREPSRDSKKSRSRDVDSDDTAKSVPVTKEAESKKAAETENSTISGAKTVPSETARTDTSKTDTAAALDTVKSKVGAQTENSTIVRADNTVAGSETKDVPKTSQNVGCKKYFPTAGMTLSVPCE